MFSRLFSRGLLAVLLAATLAPALARANEPIKQPKNLDGAAWESWRRMPVLFEGRMMPLDTFARQAVQKICGVERPTLGLVPAVSAEDLKSSDYAEALELFPGGKERRFDPVELLFSWVSEPEKWDNVPFLLAEHQELREKYLGVPFSVTSGEHKGEHLKYVSPRQVREATAFSGRREELARLQEAAMRDQKEFALAGSDEKIRDLQAAYVRFSTLAFDAQQVMTLPTLQEQKTTSRYLEKLQSVLSTWSELNEGNFLTESVGEKSPLGKEALEIDAALRLEQDLVQKGAVKREQIEPAVWRLREAAGRLAKEFESTRARTLTDERLKNNAETRDAFGKKLRLFVALSKKLVRQAADTHYALYDNGELTLRVVPALNPWALDKDRDRQDDTQPWLSLQGLLQGTPEFLTGYDPAQVAAVRSAFGQAREAYMTNRHGDAGARDKLVAAMNTFTDRVRKLGQTIEPERAKLAAANVDEGLLAHTAYPDLSVTDPEVTYNTLQPFMWSWGLCLLAGLLFVSCLVPALRAPMFWVGLGTLVAGMAFMVVGFVLRISVTHWAPVTNMYETMLFVPFMVSVMGVWFAMLPLTWPGMRNAWRMTAIPGSWESPPLKPEQLKIASSEAWTSFGVVAVLIRAVLMCVVFNVLAMQSYGADGGAVLGLKPRVDLGQSGADASSWLTWAIGMCVLALAVVYVPRVLTTLAYSVVHVPLSWRGQIGGMFKQVYSRIPFVAVAAVGAFFVSFLGYWAPIFEKGFSPLQPVLRSNFWLTIHVLTIVSSYAAGLLAWGLGNAAMFAYLFGNYEVAELGAEIAGHRPAGAPGAALQEAYLVRRPPAVCATLAGYVYKVIQVAVMLLICGTILGGLWADVSWGRFWGWDPKEVWALISGLVYLAILHGRYAGWFGNFGTAVGAVGGFSAIVFSWYGVNFVLGAGLHNYGFGTGGAGWVAAAAALNWLLVMAAGIRYSMWTGAFSRTPEAAVPANAVS